MTTQMQRREWLAAGASLVAGAAIAGCGGKREEETEKSQSPSTSKSTPTSKVEGFEMPHAELEELGFAELGKRMASGAETAVSLVAKYRARINACNEHGPALRSVLVLAPDADAVAATLDAERAAGKLRGPL